MRCDAVSDVANGTYGITRSRGVRWDGWVGYGTSRKAEFGELVVLVVIIADFAV